MGRLRDVGWARAVPWRRAALSDVRLLAWAPPGRRTADLGLCAHIRLLALAAIARGDPAPHQSGGVREHGTAVAGAHGRRATRKWVRCV